MGVGFWLSLLQAKGEGSENWLFDRFWGYFLEIFEKTRKRLDTCISIDLPKVQLPSQLLQKSGIARLNMAALQVGEGRGLLQTKRPYFFEQFGAGCNTWFSDWDRPFPLGIPSDQNTEEKKRIE